MDKKRHHYVPKTYLRQFADKDGKVYIHLKDEPGKVIHQTPDNTAFHKYFYSQPLPDGGRDNNTLEDFFGTVEDKWPSVVDALKNRRPLNIDDLYEFIALQRARVPAARDAFEKMQAESVRAAAFTLDKMGLLPPKPEGMDDILEKALIAIDPHQSIHSMPTAMRAMGNVLDLLGLAVFCNTTDVPFLTSDNPVVYFDPRMADEELLPYTIDRNGGPVAFQFPITSQLMLYGYSEIRGTFVQNGLGYGDIGDTDKVEMFNRLTCRFGYRAVFSQAPGAEAMVRKYAAESPIVKNVILPQHNGHLVLSQSVFGSRSPKPKWDDKKQPSPVTSEESQ